MLKVATVCSGIGSPEVAIRNLGIEHEIVFGCEIDKYARQTYLANFNPIMMLEDMTKEDWEDEKYYADVMVGGIPCQAFSLAGKRLGELDARGLLFYDFYRYVKNQKPKYFIIENVKGLLSMDKGNVFNNWKALLGQSENGTAFLHNHEDSLMYNLHWKVLNTKNYGLPQNRERVFLIGIRNDLPNDFVFPKEIPLELRLKDLLEEEVDEKYYLKNMQDRLFKTLKTSELCNDIEFIDAYNQKVYKDGTTNTINTRVDASNHSYIRVPNKSNKNDIIQINPSTESGGKQPYQQNRVYDSDGIAPALCIGKSDLNITEHKNYIQLDINGKGQNSQQDRVYFEDKIMGCIPASRTDSKVNIMQSNYKIRKLTVLECFRLQGFPDSFVDKNNFIKSINNHGILVYICNEFKNKLLCNAKLKNVIEKQREGDIVSCTIKDSESMGTQISFLNTPIEEIKNAKYQVAIELFTQKDFVYHTTTPIENMETLYTLKKEGKMLSTELSHLVEKEELEKMVNQNTDLLLRIILDESWKKEKSYIISTLIHTIMKSVTCMCINQNQNTLRYIVSYEELPKKQNQPTKNSFAMESFILKTANTSYVSSSQLYKQAGNSISVPVIENILKVLLKNYIN